MRREGQSSINTETENGKHHGRCVPFTVRPSRTRGRHHRRVRDLPDKKEAKEIEKVFPGGKRKYAPIDHANANIRSCVYNTTE